MCPRADNEMVTDISSHPPTPVTHRPPSSRPRSSATPRRVSSAPDLHPRPSLNSTFTSLDESPSSSSSRFSHSSRCRPRDTDPGTTLALVTPVHRAEQVGSAPEPLRTFESPQQHPPALESATRTLEEVHRVIMDLQRRDRRRGARGLWIAMRAFFGYGPDGSVARRDIMDLLARLLFNAGQMVGTIIILCLAAREKSPIDNTVTEWQACRRPLGEWCAVWCVRIVVGIIMGIWGYRRRTIRFQGNVGSSNGEAEPASHTSNDSRTQRTTPPRRHSPRRTGAETRRRVSAATFARLVTLLTLFSLTWFVTAHVFLYTSVYTCRLSSPHLWWLTFGILCIGYLIILEVALVALIVFILGPLIFLFLNLVLVCMGRQPLRVTNHINPDIGKMSQKSVDLIPLVHYIPAPVPKESRTASGITGPQEERGPDISISPLAVPEAAHVHSYPPDKNSPASPASSASQRTRRLFTFRRIRKSAKSDKEKGKAKQPGPEEQYEDKWERGEYPFVKLEGNRAACAICLCDFEAPRRTRYSIGSRPTEDLDQAEKGVSEHATQPQHDGGLRLIDAGEGVQPLRLLACAHVFHRSCLDPWLTEISGRCPVCQRPVKVDDSGESRR